MSDTCPKCSGRKESSGGFMDHNGEIVMAPCSYCKGSGKDPHAVIAKLKKDKQSDDFIIAGMREHIRSKQQISDEKDKRIEELVLRLEETAPLADYEALEDDLMLANKKFQRQGYYKGQYETERIVHEQSQELLAKERQAHEEDNRFHQNELDNWNERYNSMRHTEKLLLDERTSLREALLKIKEEGWKVPYYEDVFNAVWTIANEALKEKGEKMNEFYEHSEGGDANAHEAGNGDSRPKHDPRVEEVGKDQLDRAIIRRKKIESQSNVWPPPKNYEKALYAKGGWPGTKPSITGSFFHDWQWVLSLIREERKEKLKAAKADGLEEK